MSSKLNCSNTGLLATLTLMQSLSCCAGIGDLINARTAQDFAMAGITAMAISYAVNSPQEDSKDPAPSALSGSMAKLEAGYIKEQQDAYSLRAIVLSSMLVYSTLNAICLIWANDSYSGFESEYFRLFRPFASITSQEMQEQWCYIATVLHAGFALTSAFHVFSTGYMCNDTPINTPVWMLRIMALASPAIGRSGVTELAGFITYFVISEACKDVAGKSTERIRKNDKLIKEIAA